MKCKGLSRMLLFATKQFHFSPLRGLILPSYVEVQAQVLTYGVSLPRVRNPLLYYPPVKKIIDDEALEWNRSSLCWTWGLDHSKSLAFVQSLGWVESSNKDVCFLFRIFVLHSPIAMPSIHLFFQFHFSIMFPIFWFLVNPRGGLARCHLLDIPRVFLSSHILYLVCLRLMYVQSLILRCLVWQLVSNFFLPL